MSSTSYCLNNILGVDQKMAEEVLYERLTPPDLESRLKKAPIAYLPLGTLEWHGAHLPLGSDFLQSQGFFVRLAERVGGIVLPPLFLGPDRSQEVNGFEYYGMDLSKRVPNPPQQLTGSAYWVPSRLFSEMIEAILKQLRRAGFRVVVAHGHGPSTIHFIEHREELSKKFGLVLFTLWPPNDEPCPPEMKFQTGHAGMNETSIMMALHSDLIRMENLPKDLNEWPLGIGGPDPRVYASADHGENVIRFNLERMEKILKEQLAQFETV